MPKVVCEIGKFTIRDAILFHKFCIFNKDYFVFLAHQKFVFKCVCVVLVIFLLLFSFSSFTSKGKCTEYSGYRSVMLSVACYILKELKIIF